MVKLQYKWVHQCYTLLCVWCESMYVCICVFMHMKHRGWYEVSYSVVLHYILCHRVSHWAQRSPVWLHHKPWGLSCVYFLVLGLKHTIQWPGFYMRAGDTSSGPQDCLGRMLLINSSLQSLYCCIILENIPNSLDSDLKRIPQWLHRLSFCRYLSDLS